MTREMAINILRGAVLGTNEQTHEAVFMAIKALKEQERVDAVEAVRCKDCKWASACYGDIVRASKGGGEVHIPLGTDGYCSFAERREDETD